MENENSLDIVLPEVGSKSQIGVYLKIVFIPIIVFAVFLLGFLGLISLKVELHSILMLGILLFIALLAARHNAEYATCIFEKNKENFRSNLKNFIMNTLFAIGSKRKSNASFDSFVSEYSQNIRNDNYASVMAGIFPMLGILGTFISIAISMPNFSSSNIDALEGEIAQLLGGVGTAFYVSIFGIFLAIWWIYFEKKGISKFEKLIEKYKSATKAFFWSKDEISLEFMSELIEKNAKLNSLVENGIKKDFSHKISLEVEKKFENFSNMLDLESESLKNSSLHLEKTHEIVERTNKIYQDLNLNYDKILSSIGKLGNDIVTIQNSLSSQYKEIFNLAEAKSNNLDKNISVLASEISDFTQNLREISDEIKQYRKKSSLLDDKEILKELKKSLNSDEI